MATSEVVLRVLGAVIPTLLAVLAWVGRGDSEKSRLARVQREIETLHALPEDDERLRRMMRRRVKHSIRNYDYFIKRRPSRRLTNMAIFMLGLSFLCNMAGSTAKALANYNAHYKDSAFLLSLGSELAQIAWLLLALSFVPMAMSIFVDPVWDGVNVPGRKRFAAWRKARAAKSTSNEDGLGPGPEESSEVDGSGV